MDLLQQRFSVPFEYRVFFTTDLFRDDNPVLSNFFAAAIKPGVRPKILAVVDEGVLKAHPGLPDKISRYFSTMASADLVAPLVALEGGENVKNSPRGFEQVVAAIDRFKIDRHSYVMAIGGGSVLDVAGYAAAVSHRGIRLIRIPTTVLSQNDSGIGVKNGINFFGKKNFLGTFAPPVAVFNDEAFLDTLTFGEWRAGISEAIKVALIKDAQFFSWLEDNTAKLAQRDRTSMRYLIYRCAELHLQHIGGADPFETGSSRPLDFGHWSAHKLEQLTGFAIRHGDAVALGIALDTVYSHLTGKLNAASMERVLRMITSLGFSITHPLLKIQDERSPLLRGLEEFREHLGGRLTIMLLKEIGQGEEVNAMDPLVVRNAYEWIQHYHATHAAV